MKDSTIGEYTYNQVPISAREIVSERLYHKVGMQRGYAIEVAGKIVEDLGRWFDLQPDPPFRR